MRRRRTLTRTLIALQLGIALLTAAPVARAQQEDESVTSEGVVGAGAAICTLVYGPLKVAYAIGGSVMGGLAWMWTLGDTSVAAPIFRSSVRGDYVVTPSHLAERRELQFIGPTY
jgi:hypothetical protein